MKTFIGIKTMMMYLLFILPFLMTGQLVDGTASNALSDCQTIAANFRTTVSGPVANIISTTGTNVSCSALSGSACPGSIINSVCVFQHKLAVTCYLNGSTVKIRVQSNGLPLYCASMPSSNTFSEQNIDFAVNFNPDVSVNSPLQTATTSSALSNIVCNLQQSATPPTASQYINYGTSMPTLAGVSVDGVAIFNVDSANSVDPFYPAGGFSSEQVDQCLAHCQTAGIYHYHMGSGCAKTPPSGSTSPCAAIAACSSNISQYSISSFSSYQTLTVIGIARDGHVIFGPYTSTGAEVTSGTDICNGMFYDSIGNYGYFATRKFPYLTGCYGPGNYPNATVNCSTNAPSSYTMSSFAVALSSSSTSGSSTTTVVTASSTMGSNATASGSTSTTSNSVNNTQSSSTRSTGSISRIPPYIIPNLLLLVSLMVNF